MAAAEREAATWYTANAKVYTLGADADYARSATWSSAPGASSSAAEYNVLGPDITRAIADDQSDFRSAVDQGSGALSPVEPVVLVAALLMALCCGWGLWRRLAEYR